MTTLFIPSQRQPKFSPPDSCFGHGSDDDSNGFSHFSVAFSEHTDHACRSRARTHGPRGKGACSRLSPAPRRMFAEGRINDPPGAQILSCPFTPPRPPQSTLDFSALLVVVMYPHQRLSCQRTRTRHPTGGLRSLVPTSPSTSVKICSTCRLGCNSRASFCLAKATSRCRTSYRQP